MRRQRPSGEVAYFPGTAQLRSAVVRRPGHTRSLLIHARDVKNRSVVGSIQKTSWSKAVRGSSRPRGCSWRSTTVRYFFHISNDNCLLKSLKLRSISAIVEFGTVLIHSWCRLKEDVDLISRKKNMSRWREAINIKEWFQAAVIAKNHAELSRIRRFFVQVEEMLTEDFRFCC